jgi:CheY-like chemotaxis protein
MPAPRVLIVEDEFLVRDMIVYELELAGFEVIHAGSAEEGLALLKPADPLDLLFTDIRLPGMNGWQLAERVRAARPQVPVVYASGYAERAEAVARSKFLQKPYLPSQVLQAAAELGIKLPENPSR